MNYEEQYKYYVFKFNVTDGNYYILERNELPNSGFSSLYAVSAETATSLETSGFAGWKGTCWSPELWLDFDTPESGMAAKERLGRLGLGYKMYQSGGKGYHFAIPRPHTPSHQLPLIDKQWVLANFPEADPTIYIPLGMFRLEGTRHQETGEKKKFLESVEGSVLILPETVNVTKWTQSEESGKLVTKDGGGSIFTNWKIQALTVPQNNGSRNTTLATLGMSLRRAGESLDFIHRYLHHVNLMYSPPVEDVELEKVIKFIGSTGL